MWGEVRGWEARVWVGECVVGGSGGEASDGGGELGGGFVGFVHDPFVIGVVVTAFFAVLSFFF